MAQQPDVAAVQVRVIDPVRTSLAVRFVGALGGTGEVLGVLDGVVGVGGAVPAGAAMDTAAPPGAGATPGYAAGVTVPASAAGAALRAVPSTTVDSTTAASRPGRRRRNSEDERTPVICRRCRKISMIANVSHASAGDWPGSWWLVAAPLLLRQHCVAR